MEENSKNLEWDTRTHKRSEELDRTKLAQQFAKYGVIDWNLTGEILTKLVDMEEYPEGAIPYSKEDCAALLEANLDLFQFVRENCREMALFDAVRRAEETKNSSASPGESSESRRGVVAHLHAENA